MTQSVRLTVQYDGTDFHGWQRMPGVATIQEELEKALRVLLRHDVVVTAAGRTDAGVHAEGQVVSFPAPVPVTDELLFKLRRGMNALMAEGIVVTALREAPADWDARREAVGKRYVYRIHNLPTPPVFTRRYRWHVQQPLDVEAMERAAQCLLGEQDFEAFRASGCQAEHAYRYLWRVTVKRLGDDVEVEFRGNAFVRSQVRIMVGTLVEVGLGKRSVESVAEILRGRDRTKAGRTAPATGLFLAKVYYPEDAEEAGIPKEAKFPGWPPGEAGGGDDG
ncbi:MAG: tRNA pseudouridine(38-40) synthase TruA [Myxococcota bacterium]